jgi:hypothetical protein
LHIPFVEEAKITGNIAAFPFQLTLQAHTIPKPAAAKDKAVKFYNPSLSLIKR